MTKPIDTLAAEMGAIDRLNRFIGTGQFANIAGLQFDATDLLASHAAQAARLAEIDRAREERADAIAGKSLGEKLCEASGPFSQCWKALTDASRAEYERVALTFATSLSHDETASAVIADQAETIEAQSRLITELDAKLVESEAREGVLAKLAAEYRPTMDREVVHSWAQDVVAALTLKGGRPMAKLTKAARKLLEKMADEGLGIIHSNDGDRAWLRGLGDNPVWGDIPWSAMAELRNAGLIGDEDDGDGESRFHPAEVITPAGRAALAQQRG